MYKLRRVSRFAVLLGAFIPSSAVFGAVQLILTDGDASPSATVVNPGASGATFNVTLNLASTTTNALDKVTGVDFYLQLLPPPTGSGVSLTGRDTSASAFPDLIKPNSLVLASPANRLDPENDVELSQSGDVNAPISNATVNVANYVFTVAAGTPNGVYLLSPSVHTGQGYVGQGPDFVESAFTPAPSTFPTTTGGTGGAAGTTFRVTVVPEPSSALLFASGAIGLFVRRRSSRQLSR